MQLQKFEADLAKKYELDRKKTGSQAIAQRYKGENRRLGDVVQMGSMPSLNAEHVRLPEITKNASQLGFENKGANRRDLTGNHSVRVNGGHDNRYLRKNTY